MQDEKKKYAVNNRGLANSLRFIGGFDYQTYDDINHEGREIFMFQDSEEFRIMLSIITNLTKIYKNK